MEDHAHSRPGDYLLNRYFPDADEETRERARDAFGEFARLLEELGETFISQQEPDSRDPDAEGMIRSTTTDYL